MAKRVLSAIIALPILTLVVWVGGMWYAIIVSSVCVAGTVEYHRLSPSNKSLQLCLLSIIGTLTFLLNAYLEGRYTGLVLTIAIVISLSSSIFVNTQIDRYTSTLWVLGGMLYLGWLGGHFLSIRGLEMGRQWAMLTMYATFATDTGAFLIGTWKGHHRMVPGISPGKTWEGAMGGLAGGVLAAPVMAALLGLNIPIVNSLIAGAIIGVASQVGDLVESMVKRSAGVKDAGFLIPGHGGVLDRLDSLVFVIPLIYYYAQWLTIQK